MKKFRKLHLHVFQDYFTFQWNMPVKHLILNFILWLGMQIIFTINLLLIQETWLKQTDIFYRYNRSIEMINLNNKNTQVKIKHEHFLY